MILGLSGFPIRISALEAMTTVTRDCAPLVTRADPVFEGTVSSRTSQGVGEGAARPIVTLAALQVQETYQGQAAGAQTLRFLGGTVGSDTLKVPAMPAFEVGQKAGLFVGGNGRQFCPWVGVARGRLHVVREEATGRERVFTNEGSPVVDASEIGQRDDAGGPRRPRDLRPGPVGPVGRRVQGRHPRPGGGACALSGTR